MVPRRVGLRPLPRQRSVLPIDYGTYKNKPKSCYLSLFTKEAVNLACLRSYRSLLELCLERI